MYLRPKSTGTRSWEDARKLRDNWLAWGGTEPPVERINPADELVTVPNAVEQFLTVKKNQPNIQEERLADVKRLVKLRLIPFAESKRIKFIQEMDNARIWGEFPGIGWRLCRGFRFFQLFRAKRRRPRHSEETQRPSTSARFASLYDFVFSREWLSDNWASAEHGMKASKVIEPKDPFGDAYGHTHALWCHPMKTKDRREVNFVHIPIQADNLPGHPNLVKALQELPLKQGQYFFLGGAGKLRTNINSWRSRVNDIFVLADALMRKDGLCFTENPHPHRFRHTFAATLLKDGVPLRVVAQYLGDTEQTVRKHYAKFCLSEQVEAAAILAEAMKKMVQRQAAEKKKRLQIVT